MALTKSQRKKTVRYVAMTILVDVEQNGSYVNLQLSHALDRMSFSSEDSNLLTEIVYGVTQRRILLDNLLAPYIKKSIPLWLRSILRLSVFQMLFLDRVPMYAIVNEASEIARIKAGQGIVNFVNGVLRNLAGNVQKQYEALLSLPLTNENVSMRTSLPLWLVNYFEKRLGLVETEQLGLSLLDKPALSVRAKDVDTAYQILSEQFHCQKSILSPQGIRLSGGNVHQTDLFLNGDITIQDETSMLVAACGRLKETDIVLDACAAPGGKTTHMAQYLSKEQGAKIHALDLHEHKMQLVIDNAKRLKVDTMIEPIVMDARDTFAQFGSEYFDVAFVDAPCSGLGLMRRKPDIKYTKTIKDIYALCDTQMAILDSVSDTVKTGGRLVYSTCTLSMEENEKMISRFLEKHKEFCIEPLEWLQLPQNCYTKHGMIEIFPHIYHTDGFFICALVKQKK